MPDQLVQCMYYIEFTGILLFLTQQFLPSSFSSGESAGGNLATVVSLKLRDEGFTPKLKQQVLVYPGVQFVDYLTPGVQQNKNTPLLKQSSMGFYASMYLFGNSSYASAISQNKHVPKDVRKTIRESYFNYKDLPAEFLSLGPYNDEIDENHQDVGVWPSIKDKIMSPYLSPLYAEDLSGLPDAFVLTCLYDPIRDGGYMYARRLKKYGIKVTYKNYKTGFHGVYNVHHMFKEGQEMLDDVVDHLKKELWGSASFSSLEWTAWLNFHANEWQLKIQKSPGPITLWT